MKAEVIARGLVHEGEECAIGEVIDVSKVRFERSVKLAKPGTTKKQRDEQDAVNKEAAKVMQAAKEMRAKVETRAAGLDAIEAGFKATEAALAEREKAVTAAEAALAGNK